MVYVVAETGCFRHQNELEGLLALALRWSLAREVGLLAVTFANRMDNRVADGLTGFSERYLAEFVGLDDLARLTNRVDVVADELAAFGHLDDLLVSLAVDNAEGQLGLRAALAVEFPGALVNLHRNPVFSEVESALGSCFGGCFDALREVTGVDGVDDTDIAHGITLS